MRSAEEIKADIDAVCYLRDLIIARLEEYDFNIFETITTTDSNYLELVENDIYEEEKEDEVHDSDLIN